MRLTATLMEVTRLNSQKFSRHRSPVTDKAGATQVVDGWNSGPFHYAGMAQRTPYSQGCTVDVWNCGGYDYEKIKSPGANPRWRAESEHTYLFKGSAYETQQKGRQVQQG